jgi:hypothetical protein
LFVADFLNAADICIAIALENEAEYFSDDIIEFPALLKRHDFTIGAAFVAVLYAAGTYFAPTRLFILKTTGALPVFHFITVVTV